MVRELSPEDARRWIAAERQTSIRNCAGWVVAAERGDPGSAKAWLATVGARDPELAGAVRAVARTLWSKDAQQKITEVTNE